MGKNLIRRPGISPWNKECFVVKKFLHYKREERQNVMKIARKSVLFIEEIKQ